MRQQTGIGIMSPYLLKSDVEAWAYCLMPNHVHLILVPADPDGLACPRGAHVRRANPRSCTASKSVRSGIGTAKPPRLASLNQTRPASRKPRVTLSGTRYQTSLTP